MDWKKGDVVVATKQIVADDVVHAEEGHSGVIRYIDADGAPTVRFYISKLATVVADEEIKATGMSFNCLECDEYIEDDYYMVTDGLWLFATNGSLKGQLHLLCLEKRIGRKLRKEDFIDAPINHLMHFAFDRAGDRVT